MIKKWIKNKILEHSADMSGVVPEQKWSDREGCFFLNSSAGLIRFKPKDQKQASEFRNKYINEFESIRLSTIDSKTKNELFFRLYAKIRSKEKVSYSANAHTRLRGLLCSF